MYDSPRTTPHGAPRRAPPLTRQRSLNGLPRFQRRSVSDFVVAAAREAAELTIEKTEIILSRSKVNVRSQQLSSIRRSLPPDSRKAAKTHRKGREKVSARRSRATTSPHRFHQPQAFAAPVADAGDD